MNDDFLLCCCVVKEETILPPGFYSIGSFLQSAKTIEFFFILPNVVVDIVRVRINAIRFIFFEADVRTFEIRITA